MAKRGTMRDVQMIGSEADTTPNSPKDMRQSAFPGGTVQFTGSEAELSSRTTPLGSFEGAYSKNVRGGAVTMIGSGAEVNRTAHRGWDSWDTPISGNSGAGEEAISNFPKKLIG